MIGLAILGATGSIGKSTLEVVKLHPDLYQVIAVSANKNTEKMAALCAEVKPRYAVMADPVAAGKLQKIIGEGTTVLSGKQALIDMASLDEVDYVMAAIVGAAGLAPSLAAAKRGKRVLLANKEALVMAGQLFMDEIDHNNATLLPIDSEHNAIFQCLPQGKVSAEVKQIMLTASGGPFLNKDELDSVTPEEACAHPNWDMGKKISVDSATMMNKGLEVIEAFWLFGVKADIIKVVIHPQSVIHSMVEYVDGSVLAQLGSPDMKTPIAHALAWPNRIRSGSPFLDIIKVGTLDFIGPNTNKFKCLRLAYDSLEVGGSAMAVLNAANEIAVSGFLARAVSFPAIANIIEDVLSQTHHVPIDSLETVIEVDKQARENTTKIMKKYLF